MQSLFSLIKWISLGVAFCIALALQSGVILHAQGGQQGDAWDVIPGRIIIEYKPEESEKLKAKITTSAIPGLSLTPIEEPVKQRVKRIQGPTKPFISLLPNTFIGEFDPVERDRIFQALAADPNVVYFEPDRVRVPGTSWGTSTPNDPDRGVLWGMDRIGAPLAWARQSAARSTIRVAVMERRYDNTHQDLIAQDSPVINNTEPITDHATHVAGTIAATGNNNTDVVGVANVELVSLSWRTSSVKFVQQVTWAVNNQVRVINMSFKYCGDDGIDNGNDCKKCLYTAPSLTEQNAINNALVNIIFVASAANDSCSVDGSERSPLPASYDGVIGVSALNQSDGLASFSNFGSYVDLTAPGVNIRSTIMSNNTASWSGTSMAAPHAAGSAAAVLAIEPTFDIRSISRLLALTAEDIGVTGRDNNFGEGVVRVDRAVAAIADVYAERSDFCGSLGTLNTPYCNLSRAINNVPTGGTIGLVSGPSFNAPITISKPSTLISVGGTARVGGEPLPFVIVEVIITRFEEKGDPDKSPGSGDYFAQVSINNGVPQKSPGDPISKKEFNPRNWFFTAVVDQTLGSIPVTIEIIDEDTDFFDEDDPMDISPVDKKMKLDLELDLNTGDWTGDIPRNQDFSEGDGDKELPGDGGNIGKVYFDIVAKPTAITLLSFTAEPAPGRITLAWQTGTETDNAGFYLWRREGAAGKYAKLNEVPIPAKGDPESGASYTYIDTTVEPGKRYYYRLEDVDTHGVSTFHELMADGPVLAATAEGYSLYLPLLIR